MSAKNEVNGSTVYVESNQQGADQQDTQENVFPAQRQYRRRKKRFKQYKTRIASAIAEIVDNPRFPQKRLPNAYTELSDDEVEIKYQLLAKKWTEIRHNKKFTKKSVSPETAKGLSLDDFAELTSDFLGSKGINRDVVNRVLHTGDDSVQVRSKKVNENAILIISYFSEKYGYDDLLDMAAEAIADSKKNEAESLIEPDKDSLQSPKEEINNIEVQEQNIEVQEQDTKERECNSLSDLTLPNLVDIYIKKYGYRHLLSEIMKISDYENEIKAKALVFDLLIGSQPPIAIIVILSQMLEIPAEKMIDIVRRSFIVNSG